MFPLLGRARHDLNLAVEHLGGGIQSALVSGPCRVPLLAQVLRLDQLAEAEVLAGFGFHKEIIVVGDGKMHLLWRNSLEAVLLGILATFQASIFELWQRLLAGVLHRWVCFHIIGFIHFSVPYSIIIFHH